jgi:oligosaccharide repeat unit polymerase
LPGSIPYLSSLVFTAAMLAGNYSARIGKLTFVAVLPLIIVIMIDFANMGRVDILVAAILFTSGYFVSPTQKDKKGKNISILRKALAILIIVVIIVGGVEFIRSTRKPSEGFSGSTRTLKKMTATNFITPSIYLYFSAHYGVLNQYFKHGGEDTPIGGHTFSPFYKILEKLGFKVHVETYQNGYKIPVWTNTGTYLRELHGDFGWGGVLFGPYLLGVLCSVFYIRAMKYQNFMNLTILAFLYVIIGLSFFTMATRMGSLVVYLLGSTVVSLYLDTKQKQLVKEN